MFSKAALMQVAAVDPLPSDSSVCNVHCQATPLFAMASVAAIISSVIHSSEVFEPFAVFCMCACLCVEGQIPRG